MQLSPLPPQRQNALIIPEDRPVYRITAEKGFFGPNDHLYEYGSIIAWHDEPNQEMEPLNTLASEAMKDYLTKLDEEGRKMAAAVGKSYTSLADAFENSRNFEQQNSKRIELLTERPQVPLMGAKKKGKVMVEKIELDQGPSIMGKGKVDLDLQSEGKRAVNKQDGAI